MTLDEFEVASEMPDGVKKHVSGDCPLCIHTDGYQRMKRNLVNLARAAKNYTRRADGLEQDVSEEFFEALEKVFGYDA